MCLIIDYVKSFVMTEGKQQRECYFLGIISRSFYTLGKKGRAIIREQSYGEMA